MLALLLGGGASAVPETKTVDGVDYHFLHAPVASVRIIWKDRNGTPLRTFPAVTQYALFLDGDLSQMCSGADLIRASNSFGSIIAVTGTPKVEQGAAARPASAP